MSRLCYAPHPDLPGVWCVVKPHTGDRHEGTYLGKRITWRSK